MTDLTWADLVLRYPELGDLLAAIRAYRGDDPEQVMWQPGGISERRARVVDDAAQGAALSVLWAALPAKGERTRVPWIEAAPDAVHLFAASDLRRLLRSDRTDANNAAMLALHDAAFRFAERGGVDGPLARALAWFAASIRERDDAATAAAIAAVIAARDAMPSAVVAAHRKGGKP